MPRRHPNPRRAPAADMPPLSAAADMPPPSQPAPGAAADMPPLSATAPPPLSAAADMPPLSATAPPPPSQPAPGAAAADMPLMSAELRAMLNRYPLALSFTLTAGQRQALETIYADLRSGRTMKRLLQGDVGVGKTLVALLATVPVFADGGQIAFMVPTELLAHQQSATARTLFAAAPIQIATLSGSLTAGQRSVQKQRISSGAAQLIIGTHALFSDDIDFARLRMIIVDEQHRFGVRQRMALVDKGSDAHQLYMTATPIPRTLALARYSGFDITNIHDRPHGRRTVITKIVAQRNERRIYDAVRHQLQRGHQAYFVYPLIEDATQPTQLTLRSAEQMADILQRDIFPDYTVACIHSRTPEEEKRLRMERFVAGDVHILVATSVIEVGVDVANATCIVINNAERFGLAALHQLRGRVGRSSLQSYAFLMYHDSQPLSDDAKSRLKVIYRYTDGFLISEADMFIRGPGELTGTKQSGTSDLKVVRFPQHLDILQQARAIAQQLLAAYPDGAFPSCIADIQQLFG